ncbi:hypothetical protein ACJJTC_004368 [Scirpophaga incertulas]
MSERKGTKALELWCKRLVKDCPNVQIDNMTTSWRNGIAFCALVHHFRPDLIDMSKLQPENIYENNKLAFTIAEKHLGIPSLLDPEDMVENDVPDRLSILTYLSQFYQRLGHTVNTKSSESESKTISEVATSSTPIKFGKSGLDKCAACGLPVYLAQRLIVSHKLYHRRCFRCCKCSGQLNPKSIDIIEGSEFICDSCKNEKTLTKFFNNNDHDQMGMLAFTDDIQQKCVKSQNEESITSKHKARPLSIIEKINMFEKNSEKEVIIDKISDLSLKDNVDSKHNEISSLNIVRHQQDTNTESNLSFYSKNNLKDDIKGKDTYMASENVSPLDMPSKVYRSNKDKFNFLQTQLNDVSSNSNVVIDDAVPTISITMHNEKDCLNEQTTIAIPEHITKCNSKEKQNVTDDSRLANSILDNDEKNKHLSNTTDSSSKEKESEIKISVPPRKKKQNLSPNKKQPPLKKQEDPKPKPKEYPEHLNPFSDEDDEEDITQAPKKASTNPFGSSDEEDDIVPPIQAVPKLPMNQNLHNSPVKRVIKAYNPFWSDGEEPSSEDEQTSYDSSAMYKSSIATSTPNLPSSTLQRRKKAKAPPPPAVFVESSHLDQKSTSMDDVASISSLSSYNSMINSDQKSCGKCTPRSKKKRLAPTPPDSISTMSGCGGSLEKGLDSSGIRSSLSDGGRRTKGPAPGLPLPERREVKMQMSPEELQVQLDLLETQQLGLERQGVLIEQMIRDKCEGDEPSLVPQEEVEDLVIQLCELVNEKNDLFRKQTELMYIRRQQRLEQEQADIEHEIRIIQSRPAVNRIDSDKAREEQLVSRLVEIVRMRDELVQQIDTERRRERQEDLAIAASIANKRAQRNSESNTSSIKSGEVSTPSKKNKVKEKVKKQLKKAKHTLIAKKKDEGISKKEEKPQKEKNSK